MSIAPTEDRWTWNQLQEQNRHNWNRLESGTTSI